MQVLHNIGFESRLKLNNWNNSWNSYYIKWGFESRLKLKTILPIKQFNYIKWGFESRLKLRVY